MKKVIYSLIFTLLLNFVVAGVVFAKPVDKVDFTTEAGNAVVLSKLNKLEKNEKVELKDEVQLYKTEVDGEKYVVELIGSSDKKKQKATDEVTAAEYGFRQITANIYSVSGILQGTFKMTQDWQYSNGTFTYVPWADVSQCSVPWYSWPNYWTNPSIAAPVYNSGTQCYTSIASKDLVISSFGYPVATITSHGEIEFDAYGNSWFYYWES